MKTQISRLDVLIYAHDGRGLGHVSRSVAIGLALRRLYPELRVCLLTGCAQTQELIGSGTLDWLKLPGYQTEVIGGKSVGADGLSGYDDSELGALRAAVIRQTVALYRPRIVLADHSPQGKHKELLPALEASQGGKESSRWILGMRGIVGAVKQTQSSLARDVFKSGYSALLWYGDSRVLGRSHLELLQKRFSKEAVECGYVSRLKESQFFMEEALSDCENNLCTISVPWAGEYTKRFLEHFADFIERSDTILANYRFFLGNGISSGTRQRLRELNGCRIEPFGSAYIPALVKSKAAVIYGGYNSLVDVLAAGCPSLVLARDMRDREQHLHLEALVRAAPDLIAVDEQACNASLFTEILAPLLLHPDRYDEISTINLNGAEKAAHVIAASLERLQKH